MLRPHLLFLSGVLPASLAVVTSLTNSHTSLTLLYQNNLNFTDDVNHNGAILLDPMTYDEAGKACELLNEKLLPLHLSAQDANDLSLQLRYQTYSGYSRSSSFWGDRGILIASPTGQISSIPNSRTISNVKLPVLCTQTQPGNDVGGFAAPPPSALVSVESGNIYHGFRNKKGFWFAGIRYAEFPGRFKHSSLYTGNGSVVPAQLAGSECLQYGSGSEDCFFLNIETPYIPKAGAKENLRPVVFWIHGGGFTGGQGVGNGGQFATREDIVTVTINYRLSTYGFMAVPGHLNGNYGLGDQITALDWVIANIAKFGGDPKRITIAGQSAGAGSVRVMLGSPKAIGKFQGAVGMSNLGFDTALGVGSGYGTTYSSYLTINASYAIAGQNIFHEAGCNQTNVADQIACLTIFPGDLTSFPDVARYPVQDGQIINTEELILTHRNPNTAYVPIIFGIAEEDGGSLGSYSQDCTTLEECLAANMGISETYARDIVNSRLFPLYDTGNLTADAMNVTARVTTDLTWRCVDQATTYAGGVSGAFPAAYYYESFRAYPEEAYNPLNLDITGTITPQYPLGDPNTFYYKVHSSDIPNFFGALHSYRDINDLRTIQLTSAYFGSFARTGQPNPAAGYLAARSYREVATAIEKTGPWPRVSKKTGPAKIFDYPAVTRDFIEQPQCDYLNSTVTYYFDQRGKN
ncbi:carboxylesterase family protein [Nemania sp. FL0916]|nr:carboxylesterase family protein [Nemania sp. FL0916]